MTESGTNHQCVLKIRIIGNKNRIKGNINDADNKKANAMEARADIKNVLYRNRLNLVEIAGSSSLPLRLRSTPTIRRYHHEAGKSITPGRRGIQTPSVNLLKNSEVMKPAGFSPILVVSQKKIGSDQENVSSI